MRITPIGKVAILLVILGCVAGVYRFLNNPSNVASNQNQSAPQNSGTTSGSNQGSTNDLTLTIQTSGTYQDYLEKLGAKWATEHASIKLAILPPKESRDALHSILEQSKSSNPTDLPDVWLASNDALVQNLSAATKARSASFANVNDTRTYAIWPPQPMVLLCKDAAKGDLTAIFTEPDPLSRVAGKYRYSFPDPLTSGGGHTALGYCQWSFRHQNRVKDFGAYLSSLKANGYVPLAAPSGGLAAEFANSQLDFIFVHNALADREIGKANGRLAKVIPAVTVWERPSSIGLRPSTGWSGEKQKAIQDLTEFLRRNPPFDGSGSNQEVDVPEHLDNEKLVWERVLDGGARLSSINQPANLPVHPR